MAIYKPDLILTAADKEALCLLGQLALASTGDSDKLIRDAIALSPSEASRLLELLEQFANSKLFVEGAYFSEGMASGEADTDDRLKGIYFSWRSKRGNTNVFSNQRWREFVLRAGFNSSENAWMWPHDIRRTPLIPIKLEYFMRMEAKLASEANLHPRVQMLIMTFVEERLPDLRTVRERKASIKRGFVRHSVQSFVQDLSDHVQGVERAPMTRQRIIALSTIVMDTAALFATRDWTATGVLSAMAAVAPDALNYSSN